METWAHLILEEMQRPGAAVPLRHRGYPDRLGRVLGLLPSTRQALPPIPLKVLLTPDPGEDLVERLYRMLFCRLPDTDGAALYRRRLAEGNLAPVELCILLRFSAEGRLIGRRIPGLGGYLLRHQTGLWREKVKSKLRRVFRS